MPFNRGVFIHDVPGCIHHHEKRGFAKAGGDCRALRATPWTLGQVSLAELQPTGQPLALVAVCRLDRGPLGRPIQNFSPHPIPLGECPCRAPKYLMALTLAHLAKLWPLTPTNRCVWRRTAHNFKKMPPNTPRAIFLSIAIGDLTSRNLNSS